jgi:hypothetical protein
MFLRSPILWFLAMTLLVSASSAFSQVSTPPLKDETKNFETYLLPGAGYSIYLPKSDDSLGVFSGFVVNYLFIAKSEQNNRPGPALVKWYGKLNILNSDKSDIRDMFLFSSGVDFSFEKNPNRTLMIPFFGIEVWGMTQKQIGNSLQFIPTLGLHLVARKNFFWSVAGGYVYSLKEFELLQGYFVQGSLNYALWK